MVAALARGAVYLGALIALAAVLVVTALVSPLLLALAVRDRIWPPGKRG